jgi:hypothetical protein
LKVATLTPNPFLSLCFWVLPKGTTEFVIPELHRC